VGVVALEKEAFDRPGAIDHLAEQPQQRDDVGLADPAMDDARERRRVAPGIEAPDVGGRRWAHDRQHALDRLQDARNAPERQRTRDEPDDLAIVVALEPPDDVNRIGRRIRVVEVRVELVEDRLQPLNLKSAI